MSVRNHPVVGGMFLLAGILLLIAGAFAPVGDIPFFPLPSEVVLPFIFWQMAAWALLLGVFFIRKRAPVRPYTYVRPAR